MAFWSPSNPKPYRSLVGTLKGTLIHTSIKEHWSLWATEGLREVCRGERSPGILGGRSTRFSIWELPKIRGTLFGGPYNKDPFISGTRLGSPVFGNSHFGFLQGSTGVVAVEACCFGPHKGNAGFLSSRCKRVFILIPLFGRFTGF